MTVCYFGMFAASYSRNRIFQKGLEENDVKIIRVNDRSHLIWGLRHLKLLISFFRQKAWQADAIFVGFPGQTDVPLAFLLGKFLNKKVVFDAFYSLYVSQVFDRKTAKPASLRAKVYWLLDKISCDLADEIILDTNAQIDYFVKEFNLPRQKFHRIFVGTDTSILKPLKSKSHRRFVVGFHGSFLPLQGVPTILDCAKLLENRNIVFKLLGNGIEFQKCARKVKAESISNVTFLKEVPYEDLNKFIASCDLYLGGPFGNSLKSRMVIPNKVFEALAVRKPVIVGKSAAISELLTDRVNCLMVEQGNPIALAKVVVLAQKSPKLREKIAENGYNLVRNHQNPKQLAKILIEVLKK